MGDRIPSVFNNAHWCLQILQNPAYERVYTNIGRDVPDPFFVKALHSDTLIRTAIHLQKAPDGKSEFLRDEYLMLLDIGEDAIGQEGLCHGGFQATMMDECLGRLISAARLGGGSSPYTVLLNLTFKVPVRAPGIIVISAQVKRTEGRKIYLSAMVQDDRGMVCTTADAMFVRKREKL